MPPPAVEIAMFREKRNLRHLRELHKIAVELLMDRQVLYLDAFEWVLELLLQQNLPNSIVTPGNSKLELN